MNNTQIDKLIREFSSWGEFAEYTSQLPINKDKGDLFERLTQLYLLTQPEYRSMLSNVWHYSELPKDVHAHINPPTTDKGIDLFAETKTGEYWAIQSKFRSDTDDALNYADLSTFSTLAFVH